MASTRVMSSSPLIHDLSIYMTCQCPGESYLAHPINGDVRRAIGKIAVLVDELLAVTPRHLQPGQGVHLLFQQLNVQMNALVFDQLDLPNRLKDAILVNISLCKF